MSPAIRLEYQCFTLCRRRFFVSITSISMSRAALRVILRLFVGKPYLNLHWPKEELHDKATRQIGSACMRWLVIMSFINRQFGSRTDRSTCEGRWVFCVRILGLNSRTTPSLPIPHRSDTLCVCWLFWFVVECRGQSSRIAAENLLTQHDTRKYAQKICFREEPGEANHLDENIITPIGYHNARPHIVKRGCAKTL